MSDVQYPVESFDSDVQARKQFQRDMALLLTEQGAVVRDGEGDTLSTTALKELFAKRGRDVTTEQLVTAATATSALLYDIRVGSDETFIEDVSTEWSALGWRNIVQVDGEVDDRFAFFAKPYWFRDLVAVNWE